MVELPGYAKRDTILMRAVKKFHQSVVHRLGVDSVEAMRATAWQLDVFLEEHGQYRDAEFARALQKTIEKIVNQRTGSDWTVEKAKKDLRGRTTGVNQNVKDKDKKKTKRPYVPPKLSQQIDKKLVDIPRRELD